ncbi:hypothetical protein BGI42_15340 (plasmid) [Clostridium taeniosporum]|uniref:Uncharacterized protein n=2 Tax=Clostridium taeniosporum TaxID=394958 RepID=A0A1D7XP56_9CLOT|nr:hypothetical protein BGI42_15340 [Clostridium taeniosporum]
MKIEIEEIHNSLIIMKNIVRHKFMFFNIVGIILVIVGIGGIIFTLNNKNYMAHNVLGLRKEQYEVINKDRFNNIMVNQSIIQFIWILLIGVLYFISKSKENLGLVSLNIFPTIIFSKKAKKYIRIK